MEEIKETITPTDNVEEVLQTVLEETQQTIFDDNDDFYQACVADENVEIIEVIEIGGGK